MSHGPESPVFEKNPHNPSAVAALVLSIVGCCGWITLFILLVPYDDENKGLISTVGNAFAFGINFVLLIAGSAVSGTFSFSGLLTGAIALGTHKDRVTYSAVVLGAVGLLGGMALVTWRLVIVFG